MSAYLLGNAPNLYNADGSPAGQMGLDGEEYPSSVSGGGQSAAGGARAVLWGDSLCANYQAFSGTNFYTTSYSQWATMLRYLQFPVNVVNNAGVSGERTDQILARFSTGVSPYLPDIIFMDGGVNDIHQDIPYATIISNLSQMITAAISTGALVLCANVHLTTIIAGNASRLESMYRVNAYLRSQAYRTRLIVGDNYAAVVDVTGAILTNALADGTHYAPLGADRVGRMWQEKVGNLLPVRRPQMVSIADRMNAVENGAMAGSNAGGVNGWTLGAGQLGVGPNNWTLQRTGAALIATGSKVARADWRAGEGARLTISVAGADNDRLQLAQTIQFRTRAITTGYGLNKRIVVPSTGAQYQVTVSGVTSNTPGVEAAWSTKIGDTIVDNTLTVVCVVPLVPGATVTGQMEYAVSSLATGQVNPQYKFILQDPAASTVLQLSANLYSGTEGSLPPTFPVAAGVVKTVPGVIPATFDPAGTATSSTGPQIQTICELWTRNAATCVWDVFAASVEVS